MWPSAPVVAALAALPRPALARLRWSTEDHWHVTLRFFGELTTTQVDDVSAVLAEVARSWADDVTAQGGPATRFLGPGLIVWPVEGLRRLARAVEEATAHVGQPAADRPFFGHLTIARGSRGTDFRAIPHLLSALSGSWPVTSLSLVHSQLSAAGAHYRDLRAFPLGAPRAPSGPS